MLAVISACPSLDHFQGRRNRQGIGLPVDEETVSVEAIIGKWRVVVQIIRHISIEAWG